MQRDNVEFSKIGKAADQARSSKLLFDKADIVQLRCLCERFRRHDVRRIEIDADEGDMRVCRSEDQGGQPITAARAHNSSHPAS